MSFFREKTMTLWRTGVGNEQKNGHPKSSDGQ